MDDDEEFYDTISVNSQLVGGGRRRATNGDYMSLSRNTVYHSALDLELEMEMLAGPTDDRHRLHPHPRPKTWRSFSEDKSLSIDFVLAYDPNNDKVKKRERFEASLREVGLVLERDITQWTHFVKIHVPQDLLYQYAEILKLRMPLKLDYSEPESSNFIRELRDKFLDVFNVRLDENIFPSRSYKLTSEFSRDKLYLFDDTNEDYFNMCTRICVVSYILEREKYGDEHQEKGIKKLLAEGVYKAAYPLHDGELDTQNSMRHRLLHEWASVSKWIKHQPIDDIKDYFGVKIALYFTWLGFYTHMLIPASIFGILCFVYGIATLPSDRLSQDICNTNITMCPLCDKYCPYWELRDTCIYSKMSYLIDNPATVYFAVFMSIWSALYLEFWKRYSAEVAHRWGLTGFDLLAEPPRAEYLTRLADAKKKKLNTVTLLSEPVVPFWRVKLPSFILSFTVVILWMFITVAVVFAIILYRMSLFTSDTLYADKLSYRIYVVPITAGLINLACIVILNYLYNHLAIWLTDMELPRTQTEYEDSLTLKIYLFQFVNYYTCIFYIAFLKGKFVGYPTKYNRIFKFRQEECQPGGCLIELTIQLAIIMIGNQAMNSIMEIVIPFLTKLYNKIKFRSAERSSQDFITHNQWTSDYKLLDLEPQGLFSEYLEMVLQYGFVTIFVTAFPLAPLFALINNIFEMRLDAKKMIKYFRRPVPRRVKDIGVWLHIMSIIGRISIVSNAFIIAFSSHFIPKLVYMIRLNKDHTDEGFLQFSLAYFNTSDFTDETRPDEDPFNVTMCRYAELRNPPDHEFKYKRPVAYWHTMAARLAFLVVYQNLVGCIVSVIQWAIPDVPSKLNDRIKREAYQVNESIIKQEKRDKRKGILSRTNSSGIPYIDDRIGDASASQVTEDHNGGLRLRPMNQQDQTTNL